MNLIIFGISLLFLVFFVWHLAATQDKKRRLTAGLQIGAILTVCAISLFWNTGDLKEARILGTNIKPGLDLRGGSQFTLQLAGEPSERALDQAVEVIRKRIDKSGVAEPIIQPAGNNRILVQIPGIDESLKADYRSQLERVAQLDFRMVHPRNARILEELRQGNPPPVGYEVLPFREADSKGNVNIGEIVVKKRPVLTGKYVKAASRGFSQLSQPEVIVYFTAEGSKLFGQATKSIIDEAALEGAEGRMAIVLDGEVYSAPGFRDNRPIYGDSCVISGGFTAREAEELASVLENPLETPVTIVDERGVDPSLGASSVSDGFKASIIGTIAVIAFTLIYYRLCGVFAIVALFVNIFVLLGLLAQFGFTLTLPGIAGIILTIGMAIDSNVLIYERIREEQDRGVETPIAVRLGFSKAFSSIMDANVTTLIAAVMMFWQGVGAVQGFAVVLCLGILSSLFSALIVTRSCFDWLFTVRVPKRFSMLRLLVNPSYNFIGWRWPAIGLSIVLFALTLATWIHKGERIYGVDFVGGDLLTLGFKEKVADAEIRKAVQVNGLSVQYQTNLGDGTEFLTLRTSFNEGEKAEAQLIGAFPQAEFQRLSLDKVQAVIGAEFKERAAWALIFGVIGIFIYTMWRFESSFAVGAIVAVVHDVVITLGIFTLLGFEFSLVTVGAVLTIAGYSINDTIVVFDRIRETMRMDRTTPLAKVMNDAINATLSRTILTGGTTLLAVTALYVFGGIAIHEFTIIILVGVAVGTYSSIFIASPIVLFFGDRVRQAISKREAAAIEA
jgi:SecD/SecF fusion protein